jgi:DNA-directed RNA polymerase specialized sigma24 family protein
MFQSTVTESFESWDRFLAVYYEPIRTALRLLPFVGEKQADDVAQSFFLKMYERDFLDNRPAITGKFRSWLYVAARRHAIDEWRKTHLLQDSRTDRLWLAFLTRPKPGPDQSTGSSLELAVPSSMDEIPEAKVSPEILNDELRILLGFWLLSQPWLDPSIRRVFSAALEQLQPRSQA